jgi:hypothetical protein
VLSQRCLELLGAADEIGQKLLIDVHAALVFRQVSLVVGFQEDLNWPAPGSEDTELGVLMELEVGHGETEVHAGIQA